MILSFSDLNTSVKLIKDIFTGNVPGQLIIQFTDACNALCPQCGMRKTNSFKRSRLTINEAKKIINKFFSNKGLYNVKSGSACALKIFCPSIRVVS